MTPCLAMAATVACRLMLSGVVSCRISVRGACVSMPRMPMVPMDAADQFTRAQIWRINSTVDVLPLVPVTAAIRPDCCGQKRAAAAAITFRGLAVCRMGIAMASLRSNGRSSVTMAAAPLATAASIKSRPSRRLPGKAKNKSPTRTVAELTVKP